MAPEFIFAEQVRSIVRSGKKEIEVPEGARISSAAADLIKEHQLHVKTVAPGASPGDTAPAADVEPAASSRKADPGKEAAVSATAAQTPPEGEPSPEISPVGCKSYPEQQ